MRKTLLTREEAKEQRLSWAPPGASDVVFPEQIITFKSFYDFVDAVNESEVDKRFLQYKKYLASRDTIDPYEGPAPFNQAPNMQKAIELAEGGWVDGRHRLLEFQAALEEEWRKHVDTDTYVHSLSGFEVDVATFLENQPEHMVDFQRGQSNARAIDIVVDINVRCSACGRRQHDADPTDPNWLMIRGAAITMLLQILTRANYQPTLRVRTSTVYYPVRYGTEWPKLAGLTDHGGLMRTVDVLVHRPGDVFDIDKINFALSHESMVRRLEWRIHEVENADHDGMPKADSDVVNHARGSRQPVGIMPLGKSHLYRNLSSLPIGDVFIPSIPQMEDFQYDHSNLQHGNIGDFTPIKKKSLEQDGKDLRHDELFGSPVNAAKWVFSTLKAQGVSFQ